MENFVKCFQTCTKCLISMNFLLSCLCFSTICVYQFTNFPIISDFLRFYRKLFGICALVLSFLLFSHAFVGLWALFKRNSRLLRVYAGAGAVFSGISLTFAVIVLLNCGLYRDFFAKAANLCEIDADFQAIAENYTFARKLLCSEACPCESPGNAVKVQDCADFRSGNASFVDELQELEGKYECSGMCVKENRYFFTDFRRGTPKFACLHVIFKGLYVFYSIVGSVFVANALILAVFAINAAFLARNSAENRGFYEKLTTF